MGQPPGQTSHAAQYCAAAAVPQSQKYGAASKICHSVGSIRGPEIYLVERLSTERRGTCLIDIPVWTRPGATIKSRLFCMVLACPATTTFQGEVDLEADMIPKCFRSSVTPSLTQSH